MAFPLLTFADTAQAAGLLHLPTGAITTNPSDALPDLALRILDILTFLAYPLAFVCLTYTAYILISSSGKPEAYQTGKKNLLNLAIGIFLITFSVIILRFVLRVFLG